MRSRNIEGYKTATFTTEIRLYGYELRKLFKLPLRKGQFTSAKFEHGRLEMNFTQVKGSHFKI